MIIRARTCRHLAWLALLVLAMRTAPAQQLQSFAIADLQASRIGNSYTLKADYQLGLDPLLVTAMSGGLEIPITAEIRFMENRNFWFDRQIANYFWTGTIRQILPGDQFGVVAFGDEIETVVASPEDALALFSTLEIEFSTPELIALMCNDRGLLQARIEIDLDSLPETLQIKVLTNADWSFSSGWNLYQTETLGC